MKSATPNRARSTDSLHFEQSNSILLPAIVPRGAEVAQVATRPSLESDGDISQVTDDPRSGTVQRKSRSSRTTTTRHVGSVVRS